MCAILIVTHFAVSKVEHLSSPANPLLKDVRKAIVRGGLTEEGFWVAESFHLLEEALRSDLQVGAVLAAESVHSAVESHIRRLSGVRLAILNDELFQRLAGTESSQGVIALVRPPQRALEQLFRGRALVVVLDGLQDPGNAGAVARSAEAFGATGLLFLKGTVSPFNPKALRASAGSLFRVPFTHGLDAALARAALQQNRLDLYVTAPRAGPSSKLLGDVDLTRKCGIIIGSEARGVSEALRPAAINLSIPTAGVESLNAAVAAAIILYEARRQRCLKA
jgi:RNA methyltransferase, TrmH family